MSFYFLDTSALVKRYHLELGTEIVDAVFAENSSTKMISDLQETVRIRKTLKGISRPRFRQISGWVFHNG